MDPATLAGLESALRTSWGPDTCAPEDQPDWTAGNPARGQCITTVMVVLDLLGGGLVRGDVLVDGTSVDFHWWNLLPDGTELDLTREQFGAHEAVLGRTLVERPWGPTRVDEQYALLSARVRRAMGSGSPGGGAAQPSEPPATS